MTFKMKHLSFSSFLFFDFLTFNITPDHIRILNTDCHLIRFTKTRPNTFYFNFVAIFYSQKTIAIHNKNP